MKRLVFVTLFLIAAPALADQRLDIAMRLADGRPAPEWCATGQIPAALLAPLPNAPLHPPADAKQTNDALCGLFRDALDQPGTAVWRDEGAEIRVRELKSGQKAVVLINSGPRAVVIDVIWRELKLSGSPLVIQVLGRGRAKAGKVHGGFGERIEPQSAAIFRVSP